MKLFIPSLLQTILDAAFEIKEDTMIIIIVVVSIIAVSIIGAIFYAKKEG